ncbi:MAG: DUF6390 family protein [Marmoricola sp.]
MSAEGAVLFARYAYPPNELGYCGPEGAEAMLAPDAIADIERRARQFEGAWSYLELLAETLGTADPLATDVVEAYWVGNQLLDDVEPAALVERLEDRFRGQLGGTWRAAVDRARAHHSFQVFEVYPWAGLLQSGRPAAPAVLVLDRCRIRVGLVQEVHGETVTVLSHPLVWDGSALCRSGATIERARWSVDGRTLIRPPVPGDLLALHWDWVCDILTPAQACLVDELEDRQRYAVGLTPRG